MKSTKNDKIEVITRRQLFQMNETVVKAIATVMRRMKMIALTLVKQTNGVMSLTLSFIDDEEEFVRPATTRSGRAITRRSEIDFSFFDSSTNSASIFLFLLTSSK